LSEATSADLVGLGMPQRFAVALIDAAAAGPGRGGGGKSWSSKGGKSKGKDRSDEYEDRGKGKGKGKGEGKSKGKNKSRGEFTHTIPVDLEGMSGDFNFRAKILGAKGENMFHVQDQTGVKVDLQGQDRDGYLELVLSADSEESLDKASAMCEDLLGSVFDEFEEQGGGGGGKSKGKGKRGDRKGDKGKGDKGKGKGKEKGKSKQRRSGGEFEEEIQVSTESVDPDFGLRAKLVGEGGRNVRHVEEQTNCVVSVGHDDGDGVLRITVSAADQATLNTGREMCEDLMKTVLDEAGVSRKRGRTAPEGKGKGKGKRKAPNDEGRAAKAHKAE